MEHLDIGATVGWVYRRVNTVKLMVVGELDCRSEWILMIELHRLGVVAAE
jgi:hypothetical protein